MLGLADKSGTEITVDTPEDKAKNNNKIPAAVSNQKSVSTADQLLKINIADDDKILEKPAIPVPVVKFTDQ